MQQNQKHTKETLYYSISRMLERVSYYGIRTLLVIYMVGETLNMEKAEALAIYGFFSASIAFSAILGGLLGDLVIGNKKSILIGGICQSLGAFSLCIPAEIGLYVGLFLIALGSGLYTPNIISNFGRQYLDKAKLLDSGFTILYFAVNLGAFLGILFISLTGEKYGYNIGFAICGLLMIISLLPILISKEISLGEPKKSEFSINNRAIKILIAFLVVGLFWGIYELAGMQIFDLQMQMSEISTYDIPIRIWSSINSIFIIPIGIIAIILWSQFYSSQFFKLMLGFIIGAISFGILLFIPESPTEQHVIIYMLALFLLGVSEIHIAPIIHSILTKYSNPKYLAIIISLSFIPTKLFSSIFALLNDKIIENPILGLKIGLIGMAIIGLGLIVYLVLNPKFATTQAINNKDHQILK